MKKVYYLKSCNTCARIIKALNLDSDFVLQDIKSSPIEVRELEGLHSLSGSYLALFSKRAMLYKQLDLKSKNLTEQDYKNYILEHYTFLKRPVIVTEDKIFIGNSKKNIEEAKAYFDESNY